MTKNWIKTGITGLRYYEHETRKNGVRKDRYYAIHFKVDGKVYDFGIGWQSVGIPEEEKKLESEMDFSDYCKKMLNRYKQNIKTGTGAQSPKENRKIRYAEKEAENAEREQAERDNITFKTFFDNTYLPQAENNKKTQTVSREKTINKVWIKKAIGHLPMKDVHSFHLEKLKKTMKDGGQSPRSIEYALAIIRQVYNTAKKAKVYAGDNPVADVAPVKVDNGRMRFLTHEEASKLLNYLRAHSSDVYGMMLLSLHAGLRFGEIAALTWADVDLAERRLTIRDAKAGSRYAFITKQVADILKERPQGKPSDYVFQGRKGKLSRISATFFRAVDALKLNDGIDDPRLQVVFHTCRHSYASWLIDAGADLYTVQKLLGHKTNVMTQRYAHLSESRLKSAVLALETSWQEHNGTAKIINLNQ